MRKMNKNITLKKVKVLWKIDLRSGLSDLLNKMINGDFQIHFSLVDFSM